MISDKFKLSKSVKILYSEFDISKNRIDRFFTQSCNKNGNFIEKIDKKVDTEIDKELFYSYRFFRKNGEPSFLSGSPYEEKKFGYCLVVEYKNYIFINSKYCLLNNENLKIIGETIPFDEFSNFLSTEETEFQKLNLKNTSVFQSAIINRSVEGNSLEKTFSPIYASKNIVQSCKIKNELGAFFQSLNSSRLTNYSSKSNLEEYLEWVKTIIDFIQAKKEGSNYLENFSSPVKYEEEQNKLIPESIMFDLRYLQELMPVFKDENGRKILISEVFEMFNKSFDLEMQKTNPKNYVGKIGSEEVILIKKQRKRIKINILKKIDVKLEIDGIQVEHDFEELLSRNAIITFEDIKYSYYSETLFVDNYLVNNRGSFLDNFIAIEKLDKTTSEKGKILASSEKFEDESVFGVLEDYLSPDFSYVFCDDLGTEYADFIACSENKIGFYHAKSNKSIFSASAFHDVVGQALKNLAYISDVENIILDEVNNPRNLTMKKDIWSRKYRNNKITTNIFRVRTPVSTDINIDLHVDEGIKLLKKANSSGQTIRIVALVVDFISKKKLSQEIDKDNNKELKQILWILSSFISSCQELNIVPQILCKK